MQQLQMQITFHSLITKQLVKAIIMYFTG